MNTLLAKVHTVSNRCQVLLWILHEFTICWCTPTESAVLSCGWHFSAPFVCSPNCFSGSQHWPLKFVSTEDMIIISLCKSGPVILLLKSSNCFSFHHESNSMSLQWPKRPCLHQRSANILWKEPDNKYVILVGQVVSASANPLCSHSKAAVMENM
jgi:hypothetical protein